MDDDSGPTASMILFVVLLLIDVFFYGFSAALHSLNEKDIRERAEEKKDKKSAKLLKLLDSPGTFQNTSQLVTTLVNVTIGAVQLGVLLEYISRGLRRLTENRTDFAWFPPGVWAAIAAVAATAFLLYLTLTLGVLLPGKIASRAPEKWAYACITPIMALMKIFYPFTALSAATSQGILRLFGVNGTAGEGDVTEEEIISMINEGHEQGVIQASEAQMISNIFELGDKEAQDIMTHRNHIVGIDAGTALKDAVELILDGTNSRYPVYEENLDHIIGILHLKDAMRFYAEEGRRNCPLREAEGLLREASFVPQTKKIDELFRMMQAEKLQMVIVVDEYGQTDGLVAMEDILEEIVGNIMDEYDEESDSFIEEKNEDTYVADGMTRLEELEERLGISFADEEFETLNGFLISRLDRIPEPDEQFDVDYCGYNFKILKVQDKMIQQVQVTRLPGGEPQKERAGASAETALEENPEK